MGFGGFAVTLTTYTPELFALICDRHAAGETLSAICRTEGFPARCNFRNWAKKDPELAAMWQDAGAMFEESQLDAALDISDDGRRDYSVGEDGREVVDHDHISRSKLRVDTRFKLLAIKNPSRYGAKVDLNHGGQPGNPIRTLLLEINGSSIKPVPDEASDGED